MGDALDESLNDLNDDTFGNSGPIGRDFDFSGTSGRALPSAATKIESTSAPPSRQQPPIQHAAVPPTRSFGLDFDPLLGPSMHRTSSQNKVPTAAKPAHFRLSEGAYP